MKKIKLKKLYRIFIFISTLLFAVIFACQRPLIDNDGALLARVNDEYLYDSELKGLVPEGSSPRDSMVLVKNFVNNWVKTTLMISQAEKNLTDHQLNFDKQLTDYKNSLIIFKYESEWINQNLDTIVIDSEIETYYKEHLSDFELKENIARVMYVILDQDSEEDLMFDEVLNLPDSLMLDSLEVLCRLYANSFYLDTANWISFNRLQKIVPIETYNQELFLKENNFVKLNKGNELYLIKFVDYKIEDDISPLDFEHNDIRNIIINKRKMRLVKKMRNDIYENAILSKEFEIYYND